MPDFFSSEGFMPHGHCYLWNPGLVWLHVVSDGLTALAYTSIPFTLVYFARRRRDVPFNWMFLCFGLFIIACGTTHMLEIWTLWNPSYWLSGSVKAVTATASVATAVLLVRLVPTALAIPSANELHRTNEELHAIRHELEERVIARTKELVEKNAQLEREIAERLRAEHRFRRLSDAGVIGIVVVNKNLDVLEVNDAAARMVGYEAEDFTSGRVRWSDLTPDEGRPADARMIQKLDATGVASPWEKEYLRKDGTRVPVLVGVAATEDGERIAVILDITDRKQAEATLVKLRAEQEAGATFRDLLEAAPDAMVILDLEGRIVLVNEQAEKLFAYDRSKLLGQSIELLVPERYRKQHPGHRTRYMADENATRPMGLGRELFARRSDGSEIPVEISLNRIHTVAGTVVSSTIRDISERKRTEHVLRRAKEAAEMASRELESFSYSVAHDLRAPLRGINGYATALVEELGPKLDAEHRLFLDRIGAGAARMGDLIDALLALARVSRTDLKREDVDLGRLAESIVGELKRQQPQRDVEFVCGKDLRAVGDESLVRALLDNLLQNAWKFTSKKGHARIEVGRDDAGFFVSDTGAGFDMAYGDKLFAPFQRLHQQTDFAGTGIGLATVQRIVQRHGGRIWAEGKVDAGATFHFTLEAS